ncbi:arylsulfatase J-like [Mya arenaria]|uniref:arylsulfatase J-like n=1 Tax=Mya arenaria TaxID=6604 RepID=UPI0022E50A63|nr:arylsulfatase J-like [Mya arenaria]
MFEYSHLLLLACLVIKVSSATTKPNIIFILADDLGWNDVSWNNPDVQMPTLDKLARKGVIFNSSYTQPTCSPSRGAIMTGYYPYHLGMQKGIVRYYQPKHLPEDKPTIAEALRSEGYATHLVGKWHLGFCNWNHTPTYRGFDSFYGFYSGAQDYYTHKHYGGYDFRYNTSVHHPTKGRYSTTLFGRRAAEIIATHDRTSSPLFLFLSFQGVHSPLQVPKEYSQQFEHIKNTNRKIYTGMLAAMDEAVERVLNALRQYKYMDNTLIVFTSDNGGASYLAGSNWPLRGTKATLWEGGTRVPTFVYSKTLFKKTGYVHPGLFHATDWFSTFVRLAGGSTSPFLDGKDQWLAISRGWHSPRREFVYNIDEVKKSAAIRVGDYKLIVGSPGRYNNWYPAKTRPACNSREAKQGYRYEDRQLVRDNIAERNAFNKTSGWWFTSPVKYFGSFASSAVRAATGNSVLQKIGNWYNRYRCDRFMEARQMEEASLVPPKVQLYNIKNDPLEKHDIAARKPVLLKKMMRKLKEYKRTLVPSYNPPASKAANPKHYGGVWSPGWC